MTYVVKATRDQSSSLDLVWILLGLEALYARGNYGLREQLVAKTELLLGHRKTHKKAFGAIYDFRSRLLHGDVNLPIRYTAFNASDEFEKYDKDLFRSEGLALAVLISTLQLMANRYWIDLKFTYSVFGEAFQSSPQVVYA